MHTIKMLVITTNSGSKPQAMMFPVNFLSCHYKLKEIFNEWLLNASGTKQNSVFSAKFSLLNSKIKGNGLTEKNVLKKNCRKILSLYQ